MSLKPMFRRVAKNYDMLNRMLTWTLDKAWRETCAKRCTSSDVIVDLCCGTGELSLHISKHVAITSHVVGLDFSKAMLERAINKEHKENGKPNLSFIQADAAHLPLKDESIDCVSISFSFRNLIYKNLQAPAYLKEVVRALRFGGKFVCVETSQPKLHPLRILYHLYLTRIVPLVGWLVSRRKNPYRYLGTSAANFPPAEVVARILFDAGFQEVSFKHLTLGLVALHLGTK